MFFTRIARILAWGLLIFGLLRVLAGLAMYFGLLHDPYVPLAKTLAQTGAARAVERGLLDAVFAVVLGVASEIATTLARAAGAALPPEPEHR